MTNRPPTIRIGAPWEQKSSFAFVPAQPGWFVAIYIEEGADDEGKWDARFDFDHIIAWRTENVEMGVNEHTGELVNLVHIEPITVDGKVMLSNDWAIKRPDGRFDFSNEATCEDEAAALKYIKNRKR